MRPQDRDRLDHTQGAPSRHDEASLAPASPAPPPASPEGAALVEVKAGAASSARRAMGERSLRAFAEAYLPEHFSAAPSPMHLKVFDTLQGLSERPDGKGGRYALAAPRGHAKSTIVSLAYVLWGVCTGREEFVLLISDTAEQAEDLLAQVKRHLERNERLAQDFPGVAEAPSPPAERWRKADIVCRNGVRVQALGVGQRVRGRRAQQHRPTLVILDDAESEASVREAEQRAKRWEWLTRALLNAGDERTTYVVVGTILHFDSTLARLVGPKGPPGWRREVFRAVTSRPVRADLWQEWEAVHNRLKDFNGASGPEAAAAFYAAHRAAMDEGAGALWPQRWPYTALMEKRIELGRYAFDSEYMNEPTDPSERLFSEESFRYWDDDYRSEEALLEAMGRSLRVVGACDPSMGRLGRNGDDSAIVVVARHRDTGILYVLDADIRRRKPDEIIEAIVEFQRRRRCTDWAVEAVQFQEFLVQALTQRGRAAGVNVPARGVKPTTDKLGRIQRLQPLVAAGTLRFSRRHATLLDQLVKFPHAAHDDGPDALEMAVAAAERPGNRMIIGPKPVGW